MKDISLVILRDIEVLIVEDEADSLYVAQILLEHYGARVRLATHGREALTRIQEHRPHFIISDIAMPVMDGWKLIEALKQDRATAEIPVIALTAHTMVGDREKALAAGFHNYLSKPLTPDTFITDLLALLDEIPELAGVLGANR